MTTFALASEYHRLTPAQKDRVDYIICDDGDWTLKQISAYMDDWNGGTCVSDIETERRDGWVK